jgi:tetrahydromethanopterin S-methyltransferase subunit G
MGDDRVIKIVIKADGTAEVVSSLDEVGKKTGEIGDKGKKTGEVGSGGFRALGFASSQLAQDLGVPFRASHLLGTKIEEMAKSSFPAWGAALGVFGIALVVAVGAVAYFTEQAKKKREEIDKNVKALEGEVSALQGGKIETINTRIADEQLLRVKKEVLSSEFAKKIQNETEEFKKLNEEIKTGGGLWEKITRFMKASLTTDPDEGAKGVWATYDKLTQTAQKAAADRLKIKQAELNNEKAHNAAMLADDVKFFNSYRKMSDQEIANTLNRYKREQDAARMNAAVIADQESLIAYATEARSRVSESANQAVENQLLRLVETHKFSVGAIMQAIGQQVKMELIGLAAKSAVYALYYLGVGLGLSAIGDPLAEDAFAAAAVFGEVAGVSLAAAAAVNAVVGTGGARGPAGSPTGYPIHTTGTPGAPTSAPATAQPTQSGQVINVHVYGSVMGDPTAIARSLAPYLTKAVGDGVH